MRMLLGKAFLHPLTLSLFNFALMVLAYSSLKMTWFGAEDWISHIHFATELWEGYGTIILGFGVLLEERDALKKIAGVNTGQQERDKVCHDYGVIFVILGVLIELLAWMVKIPNEVLNTENIEKFFIHSAALTAAAVVILQFRFLFRLIRSKN